MSELPAALTTALADRYRLERKLGEGGMATVYLAEDLKHHRRVAVKVLRPELSAILGAERFLHEITTTANLQHPHILSLFDSGEAGDRVFYVMPYVEGESLRDRLQRTRQLPVEEAVRIAREVADALDYAHRHGVIHRDIKPENILLHDGRVQVADFGIALAASRSEGGSRMTETGMSLGTPHYMSPEQAMGEREISAASDIYALGCVLYEMLIGEPPFTGPTAQSIVARVMTEEPRSLVLQRKTVPPHVEEAVFTALAKLPADRFARAAEFAQALTAEGTGTRRRAAAPVARDRARSRGPVVILGGLLLGAGALAVWAFLRPPPKAAPSWTSINLPARLVVSSLADPAISLSPDGQTVAYATVGAGGARAIVTRRLDAPVPTIVAGTEDGAGATFSPDGTSLLFLDRSQRPRKVAVSGGTPVAIPAAPELSLIVIRWGRDGQFAVTLTNGELGLLRADGTVDTLIRLDPAAGETSIDVTQVLPSGEFLVITTSSFPEGVIQLVDPKSRARRTVAGTPAKATWAAVSGGYLVWALIDGSLHAAPFDADGSRLTGAPAPLNTRAQITRGFRPKVAVADGGIVFVQAPLPTLARVDRSGQARPLLGTERNYHYPRVSPDGRRVLLDFSEPERDVWIFDLGDSTLTRVSFESDGHDAFWMPDGRSFLFGTAPRGLIGIFRRSADGAGAPDSIRVDGTQLTVHAVTPDGRTGVAARINGFTFDLVLIDLAGPTHAATPYLTTRYNEWYPALSPDGRLLAYVTDETNRNEVYVRPFPGGGGKVLVSQGGGSEPVWSRDGRELFYLGIDATGPKLFSARIETSPALRVLSRTALFDAGEFEGANPHANYDVMPDGRSFVMVRQGRFTELGYIANWTALLARAGAGRP